MTSVFARAGRALAALTMLTGVVVIGSAAPTQAQPAGSTSARQIDAGGIQVNIETVHLGARFALHARPARDSVSALGPVTDTCPQCIVAVNGDFFDQRTDEPIGGVIVDGIVWRSPNPRQNQLTIAPSGRFAAGLLGWQGGISAGGITAPLAVNDPAAPSAVVYDKHFGAPTPASDALELAFRPVSRAGMRLGRPLRYLLVGLHAPGQPVPLGDVVVGATGPNAAGLARVRAELGVARVRRIATVRLATMPTAVQSLGANHVLLRNGHAMPIDENDVFVNGNAPRTIFGWNGHGLVTMLTIGSDTPGRRAGISLPLAAQFLSGLGITNAINLDGGGSSTFVSHGQILNHPSDGAARPVSNAWVVVATAPVAHVRRARPKLPPHVVKTTLRAKPSVAVARAVHRPPTSVPTRSTVAPTVARPRRPVVRPPTTTVSRRRRPRVAVGLRASPPSPSSMPEWPVWVMGVFAPSVIVTGLHYRARKRARQLGAVRR